MVKFFTKFLRFFFSGLQGVVIVESSLIFDSSSKRGVMQGEGLEVGDEAEDCFFKGVELEDWVLVVDESLEFLRRRERGKD